MLGLTHPRPALSVVPKPVHNEDGSIMALAKQMLMDIDKQSLNTSVPTATLIMLLTALHESIGRPPAPEPPAIAEGAMFEAQSNPNLAYWVRKAAEDLDANDE
jgi:hypothetical protein